MDKNRPRRASRRQNEAMIDQFSGPQSVEGSEMQSWRLIRRAAASKTLGSQEIPRP
jgi:hypothetical protein